VFNLFKKDPLKKLEAEFRKLSEEAIALQRKGDILGFGQKTAEAEEVGKKIDALRQA
jgi:uncharacterized protein DUF6435